MKKLLIRKMLLAAVCLCVGGSAWGATTTVGATDNTSAFWTQFSDYYTIQPNRSLRLSFTNHSDKAKTFHTWVGVITSDFDRATEAASDTEGYWEYLVLRGDDGHWGNSSAAGTFTSNFTRSGDDDATVEEWLDGAHVELTISRSSSTVTMRADMYSTTGDYYWEQMVFTAGTGTQNIRLFLTTELGHMTDIAQNSVDASIYYFYQDYEDATDASSWSAPTKSPSLVTGDPVYGNYVRHTLSGSDNDRATYTNFYSGTDFYQASSYTMEFDMALGCGYYKSDASRNHDLYLSITPDSWAIPASNAAYSGTFLFKLVGNNNRFTEQSTGSFKVNGTETTVSLEYMKWYHYTLAVNNDTKKVSYTISDDGSTITNGTDELALGETNYKIQGLHFLNGRYYGDAKFDNFKFYGTGTEVLTTSVSTSAVNLSTGTATIAVATETNAVSSTIKHYYSTSPLLTSPVEISDGSVELASGTYYFYSVNTVSGSKSNSVQYAVEASETVSAPTVTCSGNTITLTAHGASDAGASVSTYYVANAPSANPATEGTLLTLNTPTTVPQGYYYIYSVSEYGNASAEPATAMSIARSQETFDFLTAANNRYETLSNLGTGDSGDYKLSKLTNSAGAVAEFINGRIECSYGNGNGNNWWVRYNESVGNTYNGLFVSSGKSDDLYVKVSAQDVVVFTWANGGLTFSGTPNVYGDGIADGSTVVSGTKYMAKANGYIKVHGTAYTTIKSIVVYSDDADMVAAPVLSSSANIVSVIPGGSADDDAVITSYYTTNGDTPTTSSTAVADNQIVLGSGFGPGTYTVKVMSYNATTSTASSVASIDVVVPASVSATISDSGWNTFSSNYALDLSTITNGTAYVATSRGANTVTVTPCTAIVAAGTGLMIKGTAGETFTIGVTADAATLSETNLLVGLPNGGDVAAANNNYVFGWPTGTPSNYGFYYVNSSAASLGAGKAYLHAEGATPSARLTISFDDETTAITDVKGENESVKGSYYDMQGRKVANPTSGLYIVNGRKVIVK